MIGMEISFSGAPALEVDASGGAVALEMLPQAIALEFSETGFQSGGGSLAPGALIDGGNF